MKLKIKPTRNTIALRKVKFRKESDFNKFLKIVSKNTKELERIKLPSKSDIKKKSGFNLLPILALGALIAALAARNKNEKGDIPTANIGTDDLVKLPLPITAKFPKANRISKVPGSKVPGSKGPGSSSITSIEKPPKTNILTRGLKTARTTIRNLLPNTKKLFPPRRTNLLGGRTIRNITPKSQQITNFLKENLNQETIKQGIKVTSTAKLAFSNPMTFAATAIVSDIFNRPAGPKDESALIEESLRLKEEAMNKSLLLYPEGSFYRTEAERRKNNINKEIDQLQLQRQALDPKDTKNYKILTDKIETLAAKMHNITPEVVAQQFFKSSFNNPIIFYPIDESQNLMLNTPNLYSAPSSHSFTGNNIIDGESDSLNISDLFLLNKLSH
tara:strand:- start:1432 stop:2592 length:1161 start_codon:yes stop_codon:yes gene_type:complete